LSSSVTNPSRRYSRIAGLDFSTWSETSLAAACGFVHQVAQQGRANSLAAMLRQQGDVDDANAGSGPRSR
jgi:hypothetical protein